MMCSINIVFMAYFYLTSVRWAGCVAKLRITCTNNKDGIHGQLLKNYFN